MNILTNNTSSVFTQTAHLALIFPVDVPAGRSHHGTCRCSTTPKCVDALTETWTNRLTCGTFIHICKTNTPTIISPLFRFWIKLKRPEWIKVWFLRFSVKFKLHDLCLCCVMRSGLILEMLTGSLYITLYINILCWHMLHLRFSLIAISSSSVWTLCRSLRAVCSKLDTFVCMYRHPSNTSCPPRSNKVLCWNTRRVEHLCCETLRWSVLWLMVLF